MRYQSVWMRSHKLYVPTMGVTPFGVMAEIDPVEVLPPEEEALAEILARRLSTAMTPIPERGPDDWPANPVVSAAAGIKSYSTFKKRAVVGSVHDGNGDWQITIACGPSPTPAEQLSLPPNATPAHLAGRLLEGLFRHAG